MSYHYAHHELFSRRLLVSSLATWALSSALTSQAAKFTIDFDHAYLLPSQVTNFNDPQYAGTPSDLTTVKGVEDENFELVRMSLWDENDVNWWQRQAGVGDYNDIVSEIEWNGGDVDGLAGTTPNYKGVEVGELWRGLGIDITGTSAMSLLDSHDYFLNGKSGGNGTGQDTSLTMNGNPSGTQGDGDPDLLTGNDLNVSNNKTSATGVNNTRPNARNLGNLLIFEENPGDAVPDDSSATEKWTFEVDDENNFSGKSVTARLSRFVFVDDVEAGFIELTFLDNPNTAANEAGVTLTKNDITELGFEGPAENAIFERDIQALLAQYDADNGTSYAETNLDFFAVGFTDTSGGIGEVEFDFLNTAPTPVPEASTLLGGSALVLLLGSRVFVARRKRKTTQTA